MGCSLASRLVALQKEIKRNHDPDFLFIEPSEMVVTSELRNVAAMGRRDTVYDIGPFITLVNTPVFEAQWQERPALLGGQVAGADLVAASKVDLSGTEQITAIAAQLGRAGGIVALSTTADRGIRQVLEQLINGRGAGF